MPRLEKLYLGEIVKFREPLFPFFFQIARKEEMFVSLIEHHTHGIIIFIRALVFIIIIVQYFHFDTVRQSISALRAVFIVITIKRRIILCSAVDRLLQLLAILRICRRIAAGCRQFLIGKVEADDRFAGKPVKNTRG